MPQLHVKKIFLSLGIFLFASISSKGQNIEPIVKVADQLFANKNYYGSVSIYRKALEIDSTNAEVLYKYGKNFSLINNHKAASRYLNKALILDRNKEYELLAFELAEAYRSSGEYRKARRYYNQALRPYRSKKNSYWYKRISISKEAANWASKNSNSTTATPENLGEKVNSNYSEYGATIVANTLYFSAMIADSVVAGNIIRDKHYFSRIYAQSLNSQEKAKALKFDEASAPLVKNQHIANPSILGNEIYFSVCDTNFKCEVWKGTLEGKRILSIKKLNPNINNPSANNTQAQITVLNGDTVLFFVSDREKGFGGLDIWKAKKEAFGFGTAINLGAEINSPDNEITPYYHSDSQTLYFSSNWHIGYGGYDIFESSLVNGHQFKLAKNLGKTINSNFNEYYFQPSKDKAMASLSSNRADGNVEGSSSCCNDLYRVTYQKKKVPVKEVKKDTVVNEEILNKYLPLSLYFHNDSPDPRSKDSTTSSNYIQLAKNYLLLEEEYKKEYLKTVDRSKRSEVEEKLIEFFQDDVEDGLADLIAFTPLLLKELEKGNKVELSVRGFASSLSNSAYNLILTSRRIESLINYFSEAENGKFKRFISNGDLTFAKLPYGDFAVNSNIDQNNTIQAIYSPEAAMERKIELIAINSTSKQSVLNLESSPEINFNKRSYTANDVQVGEKIRRIFLVKNNGKGSLKLYRVSSNLEDTEINYPEIIAPGASGKVEVIISTDQLKSDAKVELLVVSNDFEKSLEQLQININFKK